MKAVPETFDVVVLGGGPAGHKGAVQAAKAGKRTLLIERETRVGGECVHRGTIPSKTLRESAVYFAGLRKRAANLVPGIGGQVLVQSLMQRLGSVEQAHERYLEDQLVRNEIVVRQGRARFASEHEIEIQQVDGHRYTVRAEIVLIATGSRPRAPADIEIDHDRVLDSDSILSLIYLPQSLIVLGAGVIASEFATIFQALGVAVTMVDKGARPMGFLDPEISERFVRRFEADGGRFLGGASHVRVANDASCVGVTLTDGRVLHAERVLVALGRTAAVSGLNLQAAGLALNERGFLAVDAFGATSVPHILAAGDVVGPPALATSAMDQGRRAIRHALGLDEGPSTGAAARAGSSNELATEASTHARAATASPAGLQATSALPSGATSAQPSAPTSALPSAPTSALPSGIYTIPEIASVGLTEAEAVKRYGRAVVGRARFDEIARGHINGDTDGLLKLVCDDAGKKIVGAHVICEGATELIHVAQMAIVSGMDADAFVDNIFNFPTLAEAWRVAALDVVGKRASLRATG